MYVLKQNSGMYESLDTLENLALTLGELQRQILFRQIYVRLGSKLLVMI